MIESTGTLSSVAHEQLARVRPVVRTAEKVDVTKCGRRSGRNNSGCSIGYQQRVQLSSGYATYACPPNCPQWIKGRGS